MSLAPTSTLDMFDRSRHEQRLHMKRGDTQAKPAPVHNVGVTGLKHLWESKGQSHDAVHARQHQLASSSVNSRTITDWKSQNSTNDLTAMRRPPEKAAFADMQHYRRGMEDLFDASDILGGSSKADHGCERSFKTDALSSAGRSRTNSRPEKDIATAAERVQSSPLRDLRSTSSPRSHGSSMRASSGASFAPQSLTPRRRRSIESKHDKARPSLGFDRTRQAHWSYDLPSDETSTSSSDYHSMDQAEPPTSAQTQDNHDRSATEGKARILDHDIQDPAAPTLSGTLDAATQTDPPNEEDLEETSSVWSESESVAVGQERHLSYHRSSKPLRLERRLRWRPVIHEVQVIVSLDGGNRFGDGRKVEAEA
ncbi:MAG: hypothetical protein Q9166_008183 [cf. Caloplaca sp. 2 TL-2023]